MVLGTMGHELVRQPWVGRRLGLEEGRSGKTEMDTRTIYMGEWGGSGSEGAGDEEGSFPDNISSLLSANAAFGRKVKRRDVIG